MTDSLVQSWRQPETGRLLSVTFDWSTLVLWDRLLSAGRPDDPLWADLRAQLGLFPGSDSVGRRMRLLALGRLAGAVMRSGVAGDVAECGCAAAVSTTLIASQLQRGGFAGRLHVFDSFEGLSPPQAEDAVPPDMATPYGHQSDHGANRRFAVSLDFVQTRLQAFPFIDFYPGWIPERFPEVAGRRFALVNIDVDLYQPTRDALEFFWPRLNPGGAVFIDDFHIVDWPGATRAVEGFVDGLSSPPAAMLPLALGGIILRKGDA